MKTTIFKIHEDNLSPYKKYIYKNWQNSGFVKYCLGANRMDQQAQPNTE